MNRCTSPPRRCAWTRAPSNFHSTDATPVSASASATLSAGEASIGPTARPGTRVVVRNSSTPPANACKAVAPRFPENMWARRTSSTGTPAPRAMASTITPSRAPWRSSPLKTPHNRRCSTAVARANTAASRSRRRAVEPGPDSRGEVTQPAIDLQDVERGLDGVGLVELAERRPTDADPALAGLAGEQPHGDGGLVGGHRPEQAGEQRRLLAALGGRRDVLGDGGQLDEPHTGKHLHGCERRGASPAYVAPERRRGAAAYRCVAGERNELVIELRSATSPRYRVFKEGDGNDAGPTR